jgi:hypothetical protein
MSTVLLPTIRNLTITSAAGSTAYYYCANGLQKSGTDDGVTQLPYRTAGTFSKLYIKITTNTVNASSTFKLRKNGADGNSLLTIPTVTTGEFEDLVNTDTVVVGDTINAQLIVGVGGTSITWNVSSVQFDGGTNIALEKYFISAVSITLSLDDTNYYSALGATIINSTVDSDTNSQFKFKTSATLKNLYVYVFTNTRLSTTNIFLRKNGVSTAITVAIPTITTGIFEDTSHSSSIVSGDLVNYLMATGSGTTAESLVAKIISIESITTNNKVHYITSDSRFTNTYLKNVTTYVGISGNITGATEVLSKIVARTTQTLSNLECYANANTVTAASTIRLRINSGYGTQILTIPASTSGYFEDTSHADYVVATDTINYEVATGTTGTGISINSIGMLANYGYNAVQSAGSIGGASAGSTSLQSTGGKSGGATSTYVQSTGDIN